MTNILIIEPSSSGLELLASAKSMGLGVIAASANCDERIIPNEYLCYVDHLKIIDTYDIDALYKWINDINLPISAIIPGSEYHVPIASYLANKLGLSGINPDDVDGLRIKSFMRNRLLSKNIRCPKFKIVNNLVDLHDASKFIKFPCVIKPIASAGSMHVSRIERLEDLIYAYDKLCSDQWSELGKGIGTIALIEEYIDGEEFSVEGYVENANTTIISITKKILTPEPLFIEMGHIVPANLEGNTQLSIENYIKDVVKALNINLGVFHAELRVDKYGPVLIEIAGRLPGCRISELILLSKDINFYEIMIKSHLGWPIKIKGNEIKQYAGMHYFHLNGRSGFYEVSGIETLRKMDGFVDFRLFKQAGEFVPPLTTFLGRVAMCIFTAPSYAEIQSRLDEAISVVSFS